MFINPSVFTRWHNTMLALFFAARYILNAICLFHAYYITTKRNESKQKSNAKRLKFQWWKRTLWRYQSNVISCRVEWDEYDDVNDDWTLSTSPAAAAVAAAVTMSTYHVYGLLWSRFYDSTEPIFEWNLSLFHFGCHCSLLLQKRSLSGAVRSKYYGHYKKYRKN